MTNRMLPVLLLPALLLAACPQEDTPAPAPAGGGGAGTVITNRIDIPEPVIKNLGITFVKSERRVVSRTMRLPGRFESVPEARREYTAPLAGRVTLLVNQNQRVKAGTPLASLDSPDWRRMQESINETSHHIAEHASDLKVAQAELEAHDSVQAQFPARREALAPLIAASEQSSARMAENKAVWETRLRELEELAKSGAPKAAEIAEARSRVAELQTALAEENEKLAGYRLQQTNSTLDEDAHRKQRAVLEAKVAAVQGAMRASEHAFDLALRTAAAAMGLDVQRLREGDAWRTLTTLTLEAAADGEVTAVEVSSGAWVEAGAALLRTLDLSRVRFRARALQSDLGRLRDGLPCTVVPPQGGTLEAAASLTAELRLAPEADADERTVDILAAPAEGVPWARPGVVAELEVVWDVTAQPELAIPLRCVVRDGTEHVFFKRDVLDPRKAVRMKAELGVSDGRWVVVTSGVMEGSEVVLDGAYELKLTGGGKPMGNGHFHADGTYHEGKD
ncbi:MAG: biotin/lipoyl-binding protein [Planctomycetes bacterium]|nr:biotin/lipoyl-binding protein [Planctomycetota bacterium]